MKNSIFGKWSSTRQRNCFCLFHQNQLFPWRTRETERAATEGQVQPKWPRFCNCVFSREVKLQLTLIHETLHRTCAQKLSSVLTSKPSPSTSTLQSEVSFVATTGSLKSRCPYVVWIKIRQSALCNSNLDDFQYVSDSQIRSINKTCSKQIHVQPDCHPAMDSLTNLWPSVRLSE